MEMLRVRDCICVFVVTSSVMVSAVLAAPPAGKFFPLNREVNQQGIKPTPKFFPLNKGKPMKLIFSSAKKNTIHTRDKNVQPSAKAVTPPEKLSEGSAQLLSIYEPID